MSLPTAGPAPVEAALFGFSQVGAADLADAGAGDGPSGGERDLRVDVSAVVPMHNEEGAAARLVDEIAQALAGRRFEIVVVDDASTDATAARLAEAAVRQRRLRVFRHERNAGQSRAVRTGVLAAKGRTIVTLDGDGQNDPRDIADLLAALEAPGASPRLMMAAGERRHRRDTLAKKAASRLANRIRAAVLKDGAADTGCGLKAFRREAYLRLPYFDHCHRYLPALMRREGFEVEYVPVSHRPRTHGVSKYTNFGRLAVAIRDMLGLMWLLGRARSPARVFEVSPADPRDSVDHGRIPGEPLRPPHGPDDDAGALRRGWSATDR